MQCSGFDVAFEARRSGAREKYGGQFAELFTNVVKDPHKEMVEVVSAAIRMYASAASPAIQVQQKNAIVCFIPSVCAMFGADTACSHKQKMGFPGQASRTGLTDAASC